MSRTKRREEPEDDDEYGYVTPPPDEKDASEVGQEPVLQTQARQ